MNPITLKRDNLIDISAVSIKNMYENQEFNVEWTQNNTILILDAIESTTTTTSSVTPVEDYNGMQFDASKIGLEYDLSGGNQNNEELIGERKRRFAIFEDAYFSPYLQKVIHMEPPLDGRYKRDIFNTRDRLLSNLPPNRTIYFDCKDAEQELCLQGKFTIPNFKMNTPILITLNFTVDMKKIGKFFCRRFRNLYFLIFVHLYNDRKYFGRKEGYFRHKNIRYSHEDIR